MTIFFWKSVKSSKSVRPDVEPEINVDMVNLLTHKMFIQYLLLLYLTWIPHTKLP